MATLQGKLEDQRHRNLGHRASVNFSQLDQSEQLRDFRIVDGEVLGGSEGWEYQQQECEESVSHVQGESVIKSQRKILREFRRGCFSGLYGLCNKILPDEFSGRTAFST